jgi:hypothetical protein
MGSGEHLAEVLDAHSPMKLGATPIASKGVSSG